MGLGSCIAVSEGAVNKGAVFMVTESEWDASPENLVPGLESIGASTVATNVVYTKVLYESGAAVANAASSTAGALETTLNQLIASLKSTGLMNT
jgi:predicted transcriptional regulator